MTKSTDRPQMGLELFKVAHGRASVRYRRSQTIIQRLHHLESKFVDLRVCSVTVMTLRGRSGEIVEVL